MVLKLYPIVTEIILCRVHKLNNKLFYVTFILIVLNPFLSLGIPRVTFISPRPAKWKVLSVICVLGSPTDWAASTPTGSPGSTEACCTCTTKMVDKLDLFKYQVISNGIAGEKNTLHLLNSYAFQPSTDILMDRLSYRIKTCCPKKE